MTLLLQMDDRSWIWGGNLLYGLAFAIALFFVLRSRRHSRLLLFILIAAGFVLQTTGLYLRGLESQGCPLGNPFEILQFIVWSLIVIYMVIGPAFHMSLLGFFTSGLAATIGVASLLVPEWDAVRREELFGGNVWIELHAALAIFSYGAFGVLALTSLMYLLQNYSLKHKKLEGVFHFLPSLYQLETMNFRLLILGTTVLTGSLLIGAQHWFRDFQSVNQGKLFVTTAIWAAYSSVLLLRIREMLISRALSWTCIILFLFALLSIPPVDSNRKPEARPPESARLERLSPSHLTDESPRAAPPLPGPKDSDGGAAGPPPAESRPTPPI